MTLTLLLTSPRLPAGVLTREAWSSLESAAAVYGSPHEVQVVAIADAGIIVSPPPADEPAGLSAALVAAAIIGPVVWVGGADGDPGLTDALALEVSRHTEPGRPAPDIELLLGSHDMVGARLLDLVAVMDRLRDSCPWDRKQTHASLAPYLVEETYEAVDAIESGDRAHVVEELGDVLLQVVFHARVGEDDPEAPFDIDDVAGAIIDKLVRRHPHVFADVEVSGAEEVEANWAAIKAEESGSAAHRRGPLDGIPAGMPSLTRAVEVLARLRSHGLDAVAAAALAADSVGAKGESTFGADLLAIVAAAGAAGADPEAELRASLRAFEARVAQAVGELDV